MCAVRCVAVCIHPQVVVGEPIKIPNLNYILIEFNRGIKYGESWKVDL